MIKKIRLIAFLIAALTTLLHSHTFPVKEIDHLTTLELSKEEIKIAYGISMTEMQAVILFTRINADGNFIVSAREKLDYVASRADSIMDGVFLFLDGEPLALENTRKYDPLKPFGMVYNFRHRLDSLSEGQHTLVFLDTNDVALPGKDSVVINIPSGEFKVLEKKRIRRRGEFRLVTMGRVVFPGGSAASRKDSAAAAATQISRYRIVSPAPGPNTDSGKSVEDSQLKKWEESFSLGQSQSGGGTYNKVKNRIQRTMQGKLSTVIIVTTLLAALFIGGLHALQPGHGKTLVAAYLVGSRGTVWHAVLLGLVVTFTHTFSVLLLGVAVLYLSQYILPETITLWLGIVSGVIIILFGIFLFLNTYKKVILEKHGAPPREDAHSHTHFGITHSHLPGEGHAHSHQHATHTHSHPSHKHAHRHSPGGGVEGDTTKDPQKAKTSGELAQGNPAQGKMEGVSLWSIFSLGVVGGIVPCPDAIILLLIAVALNRITFGLLIIVVFSVGIAAVLIFIGIMMVSAKGYINRFEKGRRFLMRMPIVSAVLITLIGIVMLVKSLMLAGWI
jgi:ABC-type nickel/cobalt efflux system permease component RcnA